MGRNLVSSEGKISWPYSNSFRFIGNKFVCVTGYLANFIQICLSLMKVMIEIFEGRLILRREVITITCIFHDIYHKFSGYLHVLGKSLVDLLISNNAASL